MNINKKTLEYFGSISYVLLIMGGFLLAFGGMGSTLERLAMSELGIKENMDLVIAGIALSVPYGIYRLLLKFKEEGTHFVFIYNDTYQDIATNTDVSIKPKTHIIFELTEYNALTLNNDIHFRVTKRNSVKVEDDKMRVFGLGGDIKHKYHVPPGVNVAYLIVNEGKGNLS